VVDRRVLRAARNNAELCDLVCQTHGAGGRFGADAWVTDGVPPALYPASVTLRPACPLSSLSLTGAVKDSFSDLTIPNYELAFTAEWIYRPAALRSGERSRLSWSAYDGDWTPWDNPSLLPALCTAPRVTAIAGWLDGSIVGGAILNLSDTVVGVSNCFLSVEGDIWEELLPVVTSTFPDHDIVGYERLLRPALAHGFSAVGPLRIWQRV
jgi:hypothetical protein